MNKKVATTIALASMLGAAAGMPANSTPPGFASGFINGDHRSEFAKQSDEFKELCKPRLFYHGRPYESQRPHRGKVLTRFMKRVKVKAMKKLGHFKGDNRPARDVIAKG